MKIKKYGDVYGGCQKLSFSQNVGFRLQHICYSKCLITARINNNTTTGRIRFFFCTTSPTFPIPDLQHYLSLSPISHFFHSFILYRPYRKHVNITQNCRCLRHYGIRFSLNCSKLEMRIRVPMRAWIYVKSPLV